SALLDENVDTERIGFIFPDGDNEDEEEDNSIDINLSKVRRASISCIEDILSDYLSMMREQKVESYRPTINEEFPQYRSTLHYKSEEVKKLPPNLSKENLDIELYKIESK